MNLNKQMTFSVGFRLRHLSPKIQGTVFIRSGTRSQLEQYQQSYERFVSTGINDMQPSIKSNNACYIAYTKNA